MGSVSESDLVGRVLAAFYAVYYRLQPQLVTASEESLLQNLAAELCGRGLEAGPAGTAARGARGRRGRLVVNGTVIVLVRRVPRLTVEHEEELRAGLREGGWRVGVLVNFGRRPQVRRLYAPEGDSRR